MEGSGETAMARHTLLLQIPLFWFLVPTYSLPSETSVLANTVSSNLHRFLQAHIYTHLLQT